MRRKLALWPKAAAFLAFPISLPPAPLTSPFHTPAPYIDSLLPWSFFLSIFNFSIFLLFLFCKLTRLLADFISIWLLVLVALATSVSCHKWSRWQLSQLEARIIYTDVHISIVTFAALLSIIRLFLTPKILWIIKSMKKS